MKKAKSRKIVMLSIMSVTTLLLLSTKTEATTKMMDEVLAGSNSDKVQVLSIKNTTTFYQLPVRIEPSTGRTISEEIAHTRTYYGKDEIIKIVFPFSKKVQSISADAELVINIGNKQEHINGQNIVVNEKTNSVEFNYRIKGKDSGEISLHSARGTATSEEGQTLPFSIQGKDQTWKPGEIIAKGTWGSIEVIYERIDEVVQEDGSIEVEENPDFSLKCVMNFSKKESAYELSGSEITPRTSIYMLKNNGEGPKEVELESDEILRYKQYPDKGIQQIWVEEYTEEDKKYFPIIYLKDACDIAGNTNSLSNVTSSSDRNFIYVGAVEEPNPEKPMEYKAKKVADDGKYYLKEGDRITFYTNREKRDLPLKINNEEINPQNITDEIIAEDIHKITYTIEAGYNGKFIYDFPEKDETFQEFTDVFENENYIVDTTPPKIEFNSSSIQSDGPCVSDESKLFWWLKPNSQISIDIQEKDDITFEFSEQENCAVTMPIHGKVLIRALNDGICSFVITATDKAGNKTQLNPQSENKFKVYCDDKGPEVRINSNQHFTKEDLIQFTIVEQDPEYSDGCEGSSISIDSDIDTSKIIVSNGTIIKSEQEKEFLGPRKKTKHTVTLSVMPNNDGYVSVYVQEGSAADQLGNASQASSICKVYSDRTAPIINDITGVPTDWTNQDVKLSVIASDAGIGNIQYRFNNGAYSTDNTHIVTANGKVRIQVKDELGNESEIKEVEISKIDKTAPTIGAILKSTQNGTVKITITGINDEGSGVAGISFNGSEYTQKTSYTVTQPGIYTIKVKDNAGNEMTPQGIEVTADDFKTQQPDPELPEFDISNIGQILNGKYIIVKPETVVKSEWKNHVTTDVAVGERFATNHQITFNNKNYTVIVKGDVNGDGKCTLSDVTKVNQFRLGKTTPSETERLASDVNGDEKIELSDVTKLNQFRLGKINEL